MNEILLEYYQGKPKELLKCEEYLRHIIKDINYEHDHLSDLEIKRNAYRQSKWVDLLCKELADFFKIEKVDIYFLTGMMNAATLPSSAVFAPIRKYNYTHGKKINLKFHIIFFEEVIYFGKLTETEVLGVILHEIGHNFYFCPLLSLFTLAEMITRGPIKILKYIFLKYVYKGEVWLLDMIKKTFPTSFNVVNMATDIWQQFISVYIPVKTLADIIGLLTGQLRFVIDNGPNAYKKKIYKTLRYGDEKGADSFAARYGYGPDVISGLEKMQDPEGLIMSDVYKSMGPIGSLWSDVMSLFVDLAAMIIVMDEHPSNVQRANSICQKLERDLAKGEYPPELEKDLRAEIERSRKFIDTMTDPKYGGDTGVRKIWYQTLNKITGGHSDFREIFNFYYNTRQF